MQLHNPIRSKSGYLRIEINNILPSKINTRKDINGRTQKKCELILKLTTIYQNQ